MMHEIDITISPTGEVQLTVRGAAGEACLEMTRKLEEELGIVVAREKTADYYQTEAEDRASVKIGEDD